MSTPAADEVIPIPVIPPCLAPDGDGVRLDVFGVGGGGGAGGRVARSD